MKLYVKINGKQIHVQCEEEINSDRYNFALAETLNVCNVKNNSKSVSPIIQDYEIQFLPGMKKYELRDLENGILSFEYSGTLEGYFLFMQEEIYHFSIYNGWYPMEFDARGNYNITLEVDDTYELINGVYENKVWTYTTEHQSIQDCNILLVYKEKAFYYVNKNVSLYYFDRKVQIYMKKFMEKYSSIYNFYAEFYGTDKIHHTSIVFLPERYQIGAYKRDNLIVYSELLDDTYEDMHRLAHEMAHAYAIGAETNTWEDWLNETHAEWSALLYEFENEPSSFEKSIKEKMSEIDIKNGCLKPDGNKRPENVHEAGTLIYYDIYLEYGIESIKILLKTFDELENKNTYDFIEALARKDMSLARIIESNVIEIGKEYNHYK